MQQQYSNNTQQSSKTFTAPLMGRIIHLINERALLKHSVFVPGAFTATHTSFEERLLNAWLVRSSLAVSLNYNERAL